MRVVRAHWDADAKVFSATSDDFPGLVTEAATSNEIIDMVLDAAALLLADVKREYRPDKPRILIESERRGPVSSACFLQGAICTLV